MALLIASQALVQSAINFIPTVAGLIVLRLTNSLSYVGLGAAVNGLGRLVIVYLSGTIMDRFGRRAGLLVGCFVGSLGALSISIAVSLNSLTGFLLAIFVWGLGIGAAQQSRIVAADMFPPQRRGEGIGYLLTGGLLGSLAGPLIVDLVSKRAGSLGTDPLLLLWQVAPALLLSASVFIVMIKPDPLEIAKNLGAYYPISEVTTGSQKISGPARNLGMILGLYPVIVAFAVSAMAQGNMNMMMALSAIILDHQGYTLTLISLAVTIHVVGMFGLSLFFGRLADMIGRKRIMLIALIVSALSTVIMPLASDYLVFTFSLFLVGVGWSASTIAATTVVSDVTYPSERGRVVGLNDIAMNIATLSFPILGGLLMDRLGFASIGFAGLVAVTIPLAMTLKLKEKSPGEFA